jgi:hypothetical protein
MTSLQTTSRYDKTQNYHVYVDLDVVNLDKTGSKEAPILRFTEVRNTPYLEAPENYFLSVVRFALQTTSLPIFIPLIQTGQNDPNLTIYSITMEYEVLGNTITYQQYLNFVPTNLYLQTPASPLNNQDVSTEYYYVYSYQYFINMVNKTILDCFNGLSALVVGAGGIMPTTHAPFLQIDPTGLKSVLFADILGFNETLANPIKFYMNSAMYHLFTSFQQDYYGFSGITLGRNYRIKIYSDSVNTFNFPTYNALTMYQEQSACALMNPIQSIVFTTGLLPVRPSNISAPRIFGEDSGLTQSQNNNTNIAPIITDFEVPFDATNTYRPNIEYSPQSEYRLFDLYGSSPLNAIELTCFWKTQFGNLVPFRLTSNSKANLKLLFRRKDFNVR